MNAVYSLHESLLMGQQEGLVFPAGRHRDCHQTVVSSLETLRLAPAVRAAPLPDSPLEISGGPGDFAGRMGRIGPIDPGDVLASRRDTGLRVSTA